ncbi:MAG: hypothetical protein CO189_02885 [candidate division Zixibacteria bacterium CG_4_9_14_3_um_filter_46_8]|nr:MAG: hypothetical protein CO189_02885 [candidate division Zixibacteria bacterium CG_4_9_14_3_um_filter_46_8]
MIFFMITILYVLIAAALLLIIALSIVKWFSRTDDPSGIIINWLKPFIKLLLGGIGKLLIIILKAIWSPFSHIKGAHNADLIAIFRGFRFIFGHPDMRGARYIRLCLEKKRLVIRSVFFLKELAVLPLNKISDIKIEKREQARERFTKSGNPMAGVFDDYLSSKPKDSEYIFSIRYEDVRGMKHDCVFRFRGLNLRNPRSRYQNADKITNIRSKIISAKPSIDSPDYAGPKLKPTREMGPQLSAPADDSRKDGTQGNSPLSI